MNSHSVADGPRPASPWARRLANPGWLLLPLRAFLGATFAYAGLQKLANPDFLNPASPVSIAAQMRDFAHTSPIGPVVELAAHLPVAVGVAIALGELFVGLAALLGLYVRIAAAAGIALALSFFLTVSWTTTPFYYGADIVFVFAWLTILGFGDQGVFSLQAWLGRRARRAAPQFGPRGRSPRTAPAPTGGAQSETRRAAALTAGAALVLAGLTAALGRAAGGTRRLSASPRTPGAGGGPIAPPEPSTPSPSTSSSPVTTHPAAPTSPSAASGATKPAHRPASTTPQPTASAAPPGTAIGAAAALPVGHGKPFVDPATGDPAWIVRTAANRFVAFDAVCTHAGCTVNYNPAAGQFDCPCHGGVFDAATGAVLGGPPPTPLRPILLKVINGQLRVMT